MTFDATHESADLKRRVHEWLASEGYPLEFRTAHVFREQRINARQGHHVTDRVTNSIREIDVLGDSLLRADGVLFRAYQVVECKWSKDKPWVVFTTGRRIAPSACIAQTIGSLLGDAVLWLLTGERELYDLDLFSGEGTAGFGGRRAFEKNQDTFYATLQAVVSNSISLVRERDHQDPKALRALPPYGCIAFPIIVLEGELFEAAYNPGSGSLDLHSVNSTRVQWRGAESWRLHATVDIVKVDHLSDFLTRRRDNVQALLSRVAPALESLRLAFEQESFAPLPKQLGATGRGAVPALFRALSGVVEVADEKKRLSSSQDND